MVKLELPLPPSINKAYINRAGSYKRIMSSESRNWMEEAMWLIRGSLNEKARFPIDDFVVIKLWFWLPRHNCDSHNYKKLLFDAIERGGVVTNDKFILDQTIAVAYDSENPRVVLEL